MFKATTARPRSTTHRLTAPAHPGSAQDLTTARRAQLLAPCWVATLAWPLPVTMMALVGPGRPDVPVSIAALGASGAGALLALPVARALAAAIDTHRAVLLTGLLSLTATLGLLPALSVQTPDASAADLKIVALSGASCACLAAGAVLLSRLTPPRGATRTARTKGLPFTGRALGVGLGLTALACLIAAYSRTVDTATAAQVAALATLVTTALTAWRLASAGAASRHAPTVGRLMQGRGVQRRSTQGRGEPSFQ